MHIPFTIVVQECLLQSKASLLVELKLLYKVSSQRALSNSRRLSLTILKKNKDIRARTERSRNVFFNFETVLCSPNLNLELWVRIWCFYVLYSLLYCVEAWTFEAGRIKEIGNI